MTSSYKGLEKLGNKIRFNIQNFLLFFILSLHFVEIQIVGKINLTEVLFLLLLPITITNKKLYIKNHELLILIILGFVWLFFQAISDIYNNIVFDDSARGLFKILTLILYIHILGSIIEFTGNRVFWIYSGIAFGFLLCFYLNPDPFSVSNTWKFGYAPIFNTYVLAFIYILGIKSKINLSIFILFVAGVANLFLGYRSMGGILLLSAILCLLINLNTGKKNFKILIPVYISIIALGVKYFYLKIIGNEFLNKNLRLNQFSDGNNDLGIILSSRSETLISIQAIMDSPIIGHGSWAKDCHYSNLYSEKLSMYGKTYDPTFLDCLIPSHSYLFGSWIEAGVFGGIFWIFVFYLYFKRIINSFSIMKEYRAFIITAAFMSIWAILFSPFGGFAKFLVAVNLLATISLSKSQNRTQITFK